MRSAWVLRPKAIADVCSVDAGVMFVLFGTMLDRGILVYSCAALLVGCVGI